MKSYKSYATQADVAINPSDVYHERRVRTGKTEKDRKGGAAANTRNRQLARAAWQNERGNPPFPV